MLKYHIVNNREKLIASNLDEHCQECWRNCTVKSQSLSDCRVDNIPHRIGKDSGQGGAVFLCASSHDFVKSSKMFKEKLMIHMSALVEFDNIRDEITAEINGRTKRLLHNLTSLNGKNIQELYDIAPQDLLTRNINDQIDTIKSLVKNNLTEVARSVLRVAKNNAAIKTEFAVFKKIYDTSPILHFKAHAIRKVTLNLLHIFFQDFTDKNVYVQVDNFEGKVHIDYESMHVALYHLIDNSAKYIQPGTKLVISFQSTIDVIVVRFDLMSLQITDDDFPKLFDDGFSGYWAKRNNLAGGGLGMGIARSLLKMNNADLAITRNASPLKNPVISGHPYENNIFEIRFRLNHASRIQSS